MSWLFDRLCAVAVADRVEVVVAADVTAPAWHDLADVLVRAAALPQVTSWVVPTRPRPRPADVAGSPRAAIDLDGREHAAAMAIVRDVLDDATTRGAMVRLAGSSVEHRPGEPRIDDLVRAIVERDRAAARDAPGEIRWLFATDQAGCTDLFERLTARDLGIAVGGLDPAASVKVDDGPGVVSIVDALVTLRQFAFGADAVGPGVALR